MVENVSETSDSAERVSGLTNARILSLARLPIRTRESAVTLSAWRLSVVCDEGEGAIVRVDSSAGERFHRGEGVFLGWSEERLESAYEALRPAPDEPRLEIPQLG